MYSMISYTGNLFCLRYWDNKKAYSEDSSRSKHKEINLFLILKFCITRIRNNWANTHDKNVIVIDDEEEKGEKEKIVNMKNLEIDLSSSQIYKYPIKEKKVSNVTKVSKKITKASNVDYITTVDEMSILDFSIDVFNAEKVIELATKEVMKAGYSSFDSISKAFNGFCENLLGGKSIKMKLLFSLIGFLDGIRNYSVSQKFAELYKTRLSIENIGGIGGKYEEIISNFKIAPHIVSSLYKRKERKVEEIYLSFSLTIIRFLLVFLSIKKNNMFVLKNLHKRVYDFFITSSTVTSMMRKSNFMENQRSLGDALVDFEKYKFEAFFHLLSSAFVTLENQKDAGDLTFHLGMYLIEGIVELESTALEEEDKTYSYTEHSYTEHVSIFESLREVFGKVNEEKENMMINLIHFIMYLILKGIIN